MEVTKYLLVFDLAGEEDMRRGQESCHVKKCSVEMEVELDPKSNVRKEGIVRSCQRCSAITPTRIKVLMVPSIRSTVGGLTMFVSFIFGALYFGGYM